MKEFSRRTVPAGHVIFHEGDVADRAYLLRSGFVEISVQKGSDRTVLTIIRPNQIFGELALIDATPRSATAVAIEASELIIVTPDDMERHLDDLDDFMKYWVQYLVDRIRDLSKRVSE